MITTLFGYGLAVVIGISLGLIGGGGSILAVPILVYVMGVSAKAAIAMSLFIVGTVSLIGAVLHWLQGNVSLKTAALFAPVAMVGTYLGARLAGLPFITDTFQLVAFGIVMAVSSLMMIRDSQSSEKRTERLRNEAHITSLPPWVLIPIEGLLVGVLTGFVGVGGGFLIIPALVLLGGLPMKEAVGTSLLIIAFKSASGFWGYLGHVPLNWSLMLGFTLAAAIGTLGGAFLSRYVESKHLQKGFGYFVLAVAVFVLVKR